VGKRYVEKRYVKKDVNIDVVILSSNLSCKMVRVLPPRFFPEVLAASSAGVFGALSFPKMGSPYIVVTNYRHKESRNEYCS
jgi:hypothetical protein